MRITLLCDGDKNLVSSIITEARKRVTIDDLQKEHQGFFGLQQDP
jgi:hypothetical protein